MECGVRAGAGPGDRSRDGSRNPGNVDRTPGIGQAPGGCQCSRRARPPWALESAGKGGALLRRSRGAARGGNSEGSALGELRHLPAGQSPSKVVAKLEDFASLRPPNAPVSPNPVRPQILTGRSPRHPKRARCSPTQMFPATRGKLRPWSGCSRRWASKYAPPQDEESSLLSCLVSWSLTCPGSPQGFLGLPRRLLEGVGCGARGQQSHLGK